MFHTYKKDPADVPNASPGLLRWFVGTDNMPKAKDENGNLIDFVGPAGPEGPPGPPGNGETGTTTWAGITDKPSTFPPSAHTHVISDVTGLQTALDGKQPLTTVLTNTTASFTTAQETKLAGIAAGAEVNVNADWNATSGIAQILNKPTLGTAAAAAVADFATTAQGALADTAVQPSAIANFETTTQLNARDTANRDRANHTGSQTASTITDFATAAATAAPVQSVAGRTGAVTLAKADVDLGNVDNTSDLNKPISTATQTALDAKVSSDTTGITGADQITNMVSLTQAEYDAIGTKSATTFYVIAG